MWTGSSPSPNDEFVKIKTSLYCGFKQPPSQVRIYLNKYLYNIHWLSMHSFPPSANLFFLSRRKTTRPKRSGIILWYAVDAQSCRQQWSGKKWRWRVLNGIALSSRGLCKTTSLLNDFVFMQVNVFQSSLCGCYFWLSRVLFTSSLWLIFSSGIICFPMAHWWLPGGAREQSIAPLSSLASHMLYCYLKYGL